MIASGADDMDIRLLEKDDIPQAKALWKEAFGDSDRFIEWYFANKIMPGDSLGMFDGGLVSVVHMLPYQIAVQGRPIQSAFIAGAATAKNRQGQGLMRIMLHETLTLLKSRAITMTHLYPFKHSFYENFGWATYSYVYYNNEKITGDVPHNDVIETGDWRLLEPLYSKMMNGFDGFVIRNEREWKWRIEELMTDGGKAALLIKNGTPYAYMLYNNNEGKAEAIETVFTDIEDLRPIVKHITEKGNKHTEFFIPAASSRDAVPYGMARIVDAEALLKLFGAEDILNYIKICDDFADWNNVGDGFEISVGSFAQIVHQGARFFLDDGICFNPKASSEGNENIDNKCRDLLKKVFLLQATCIFEQY